MKDILLRKTGYFAQSYPDVTFFIPNRYAEESNVVVLHALLITKSRFVHVTYLVQWNLSKLMNRFIRSMLLHKNSHGECLYATLSKSRTRLLLHIRVLIACFRDSLYELIETIDPVRCTVPNVKNISGENRAKLIHAKSLMLSRYVEKHS